MDRNDEQIRAVQCAMSSGSLSQALCIASYFSISACLFTLFWDFLRCSFHLFHLTLREKGHLAGVDGELTVMIERTLWFMAKACFFEDELQQVREAISFACMLVC